jgi:tetratricopeptide (TPR) repeat protein
MEKLYQFLSKLTLIALIGLIPLVAISQDEETTEPEKKTRKEKRADFDKFGYINLNIGANLNHADITPNLFAPPPDHWRLGYGILGGWQFHPIWGARVSFVNGKLYGAREDDNVLNSVSGSNTGIYWEADIMDIAAELTINWSNLFSGYKDRTVDFFSAVGAGQSQWKTTSYYLDSDPAVEWRNNGNGNDVPTVDGGGTGAGVGNDRTRTTHVPVSLGARFHVAPKWDITLESKWRWVDSDRLDTYNKGAAEVKNDMYSYTALGVQYRFGGSDPLKGMEKNYELVQFTATPDPLESHGEKVKVKVTGTFPEKYFHPKAAMKFQPKLVYDGGEILLDPVVLKGQDAPGEGILIPETGGTFTYEDEVDYIPELKASELVVAPIIFIPKEAMGGEVTDEEISGYKNKTLPLTKLADGVIVTAERFAHDEQSIIAPHGYEKETILSKMANIYYYVNRHDLNWRVPLNKLDANKQKLQDVKDFIALGYEIKNISFDGWASPEGEETFNEGLSEKRTNVAHKYLVKEIKKLKKAEDSKIMVEDVENDIMYNLTHHGPDWNGFMSAVKNSSISDKNMILNVVNSAGTPAKKEQEIRNMIVIYPELEEEILPPLRRAEITVNCYQPKKTEADILSLALTNPRELDEKELLFAATLTDDKNDQLKIYKSAVSIFPNSYKGYVNAASIEVEQGDLASAKTHLNKAISLEPNSGEAYNNLGIVYAMEGDFAKAEENFKKAQDLGEDVNYNMGVVMIHQGEYTKAASLLGGKDCDYNVGLVQILNKQYDAAEKTLSCAPKDAQTYYLMAILGSRTDNKDMVMENLTNAIGEDDSLKAEAAMDREFIKYFRDEDFKMLVQ